MFFKMLKKEIHNIYYQHYKHIKEMLPLTKEKLENCEYAEFCYICHKKCDDIQVKVRAHCHITGKHKFPRHSKCNLQYKIPKFVPVFLHNLTNYDCHLFIKRWLKIRTKSMS